MKCSIYPGTYYKLFYLFIIAPSFLSAAPLDLNPNFKHKPAGPYLEYNIDPHENKTIDNIISGEKQQNWKRPDAKGLDFGLSTHRIWFRFTVTNPTEDITSLYLEEENAQTDEIILFSPGAEGKIRIFRNGDGLPPSFRKVISHNPVFKLSIAPGASRTFYLRVQTTDVAQFMLNFYSAEQYQTKSYTQNSLLWLYTGILLVMLFYNGFIFLSVREISYLYYIIYLFCFLMVNFIISGHAYQFLWGDSTWWNRASLFFFLNLMMGTLTLFIRKFVDTAKYSPRSDLILKSMALIFFILACFSLILDDPTLILTFSNISSGIGAVVIFILNFYFAFVIKSRPAYYLFWAILFLFLGAQYVVLSNFISIGLEHDNTWALQVGSALEVILLSFGLADKINTLQQDHQAAEKKYHRLLENSKDIIFSLDEKGRILTVNQAVMTILKYSPKELVGKRLLDYIHETEGNEQNNMDELPGLSRQFALHFFEELLQKKDRLNFKSTFKGAFNQEPVELQISLEYSMAIGKVEILGKAALSQEDNLLNFLEDENQTYSMTNYLSNAELLSHRLTRNLDKFMEHSKVSLLRICLREILINAIEHGNLNIQFEEKSAALNSDAYLDLIRSRQKDKSYKNKRVQIDYSLSPDRVRYEITDEGKGFDHCSFLKEQENMRKRNENNMRLHGRGLILAQMEFDELRFNEKGNSVVLVKKLRNDF